MFGDRKNTEWEEAAFHLRSYLEEFISSQLKKLFEEQEQKGGHTLGQGRASSS